MKKFIAMAAARRFAQSLTPEQAALYKALEGDLAKAYGYTPDEMAREIRGEVDLSHKRQDLSEAEVLLLGAFRYALGRSSAMPSICADEIKASWGGLSEPTREAIVSEIGAALEAGRAGMQMDERTWREVLQVAASFEETPGTPGF